MSTTEIVITLIGLILGSSALTAALTAYFTRKKTYAEAESISITTMQNVIQRLDAELNETREELRKTRTELRATQLQLTATTEQLHSLITERAVCPTCILDK